MIKKIIKYSLIFLLPLSPVMLYAQEVATKGNPNFYNDFAAWLLGAMVLFVILFAGLKIFQVVNLLLKQKEMEIYKEMGIEPKVEVAQPKGPSIFSKVMAWMADVVPVDQEKDILFDHEYDGIRELDNNLPPWWLYGFYLTIVIAVFYIGWYHFSSHAISSQEEYALEMEEARISVERYMATQTVKLDEENLTALVDEESIETGRGLFITNCAACHLEHGGGNSISVGPNLTDEYWLHGGGIKNVYQTIKNGVPEKGMIAWKAQMRPVDMHRLASFILTLQGTAPEGAKEAQGELYKPEIATEGIN